MFKYLFLTAALGHLLCFWCDRLLAYTPGNRKVQLKHLHDHTKLSIEFEDMPTAYPMRSMLFGLLALAMMACGYFGLSEWMRLYSIIYSIILMASAAAFFIFGTAHHVFCGVVEWFYIRLGRTPEAHHAIVDFFHKTSITMYLCYLSLAVYMVALFVAIVTGQTSLPAWTCVLNTLPIFLLLSPFKLTGAGNIAGLMMFLALSIVV